jgi:hypothetical protein
LCAFYFAHKAAGASSARRSLRPPWGGRFIAGLGRVSPRDCERVSEVGCLTSSSIAVLSSGVITISITRQPNMIVIKKSNMIVIKKFKEAKLFQRRLHGTQNSSSKLAE